jgi:hypothetical protein
MPENDVVEKETQTNLEEGPKEYTINEVEEIVSNMFDDNENNNSTICDIIAIYLKGQKILYTEAKTVCEIRLTFLMLPAIFLTVATSITNIILKDYEYGNIINSGLSGITAFILAVVSYLKLDARAEAHKTSAYKFDKLQSNLEFNSAKMLFIISESRNLGRVILDTETNVSEIKETNQFILPEKIRYNFPKLYSINVFAEVKKTMHKEKEILNDITRIMNHIEKLKYEKNELSKKETLDNEDPIVKITNNLSILDNKKDELHSHYLSNKDAILNLDKKFQDEIDKYFTPFLI